MPDKREPIMHLPVYPNQAVSTASASLPLLTPSQQVKFKTKHKLHTKAKYFLVSVDHAILCASAVLFSQSTVWGKDQFWLILLSGFPTENHQEIGNWIVISS